jgi:hypothetical protein
MARLTRALPELYRARVRTVLLAAVLAALACPARAAFRSTEDLHYWAPTFLHAPPRGPFSALLELNPRARGDLGRLDHLIVRPWLGWSASKALTLHAGYGWVRNDLGRVSEEHRAWQQATLTAPAAGSTLTGRARLEQRWLEGVAGPSWRGRLLARAERPVSGLWYAAASDEVFVHLASGPRGPVEGLDQNRLYAGIGRGTAKRRVELGYQHWWLARPGRAPLIRHVLVLTTTWAPRP